MSTTLLISLLIGLAVALVFVGAPVVRDELRARRTARHRALPHRPAPGSPPPPGARHRIDDAHTASYSAAAVLQAQREYVEQRDAAMRRRATRPPAARTGTRGGQGR